MKAIKTLAMAALAMAVFASCSSEDDLAQSNYPMDNVVRVTTSVKDINTRAFHSTNTLDEFAFCIVNPQSTKFSYDNVKVTKEASTWTPASQMLWQNASQPVDIIAYAPYSSISRYEKMSNATNYPVYVKVQQEADTYESDFLVYKKKGFVPGTDLTNGAVDITFTHALSLLNINIEFGNEFSKTTPLTSNPIKNINIGGSVDRGYADFTKDVISVTADAASVPVLITPVIGIFNAAANNDAHATVNYSAILIPQTIAQGFRVEFEMDGKIYVWTASESVTLESGKKHQLNLIVGKDVVKSGYISASPWTEGTGGTLETE